MDVNTKALLDSVDFADICITSALSVTEETAPDTAFTLPDVAGVVVTFAKANGEKCQRCWNILPDVGSHGHEGVCGRCDAALS